jgi:hypothetical protein
VDDAVRAAQERDEVVRLDVRRPPRRLRLLERRAPARDADDLFNRVVRRERREQARSDVAGGTDDDDPAHGWSTILK